jgi:hypothetical protein
MNERTEFLRECLRDAKEGLRNTKSTYLRKIWLTDIKNCEELLKTI